jgi:uncharacterized membrane protein YkoI
MNRRILIMLSVGAAAACALADDGRETVPFAAVPMAVQKAIQAQASGGEPGEVTIDQSRGEKTYRAAISKDGKPCAITVREDGHVVSRETALEDTPAAVQKTIQQRLIARGPLLGISHLLDDDEIAYDVRIGVRGQPRVFSVEDDGSLVSEEVSLDETPPAVQKTILGQIGSGALSSIGQSLDDDDVSYDVEMRLDGKVRTFSVEQDGALLASEIDFAELPTAVQKAADAIRGQDTVKSVEKQIDDGDITYEIQIVKDGKARGFDFRGDGLLSSTEVDLADTPKAVQAAIARRLDGGTVEKIDRIIERNSFSYQVEIGGERKGELLLGEDGTCRRERVALAQLNPQAQRTIKERIGSGFIVRIDQTFAFSRRGSLRYEVQGRRNGRDFDFSVGPNGRFLGMDD